MERGKGRETKQKDYETALPRGLTLSKVLPPLPLWSDALAGRALRRMVYTASIGHPVRVLILVVDPSTRPPPLLREACLRRL